MDQDEMSNRNRGLSIDASYQGHHSQFLFLIGRFLKIFYSETARPNGPKRGRLPVVDMFVNGSGQTEQSL
jgi:hypothetical protein